MIIANNVKNKIGRNIFVTCWSVEKIKTNAARGMKDDEAASWILAD